MCPAEEETKKTISKQLTTPTTPPPTTPTTTEQPPSIEVQDLISIGINQALFAIYPVLSRYLQFESKVPIDGQILLTVTKALALILVFFFDLDPKSPSSSPPTATAATTEGAATTASEGIITATQNEETNVEIISQERSDKKTTTTTNESSKKHKITWWDKFKAGAAISITSTARACTNVASAKFTFAYNLVLIMSLSPILMALADSIFLKTKLPPTIWPTTILSAIGCSLIAIAQSPLMMSSTSSSEDQHQDSNNNNNNNNGPSMTSHIIGCSLQILSTCFLTLYTLSVKIYAPILNPTEMAQIILFIPLLLPFLYTILVYPTRWLVLIHLPFLSYLTIFAIAIFIFFFAITYQVHIVQKVGPGLYSSLTGLQVVLAVVFSSVLLKEPIQNFLEWIGLVLTVITVTWYVLWNVFPKSTWIGSFIRGSFLLDDDVDFTNKKKKKNKKNKTKGEETTALLFATQESKEYTYV